MHVIDRFIHSPAGLLRPPRRKTDAVVLHRIRHESGDLKDVDGVLDFWLNRPWGIATVAIADAKERFDAVQEWIANERIPKHFLAAAFVPYHSIIGFDGVVHRFLRYDQKGAHAYPNSRLIGVAFVGDFRYTEPSKSQIESGLEVVRGLVDEFDCDVIDHDEAKKRYGKTDTARKPKQCIGEKFPMHLFK